MPKVTYLIENEQSTHEATDGASVMTVAVQNGLDGIIGECGGSLCCATCHIYVAPGWVDAVGAPTSDEDALLEGTVSPRKPESRLSCQIAMSTDLDGLVVEMPPEQ
ncbi:2Fe-2S iron-sulfur cluster-binding protein [Rhodococcus qingshengii]|uniref:2Fe-2S iron-sulfur cluster-binding protein n=1 Tax=Rhodococcus qingshengii TaxID=334542 RepID=UPI001BE6E158|nr:2Fe-2S iron-sulfur cluster-binding protein [Rhodococcus qingshengii]MBT2271935.1 (2Fe-2S)-binding protein [Rhodococcus qingshengii]